jgi:hypothetical protein
MSKSCKKFVNNLLKIRNKNGGRDILDFYLFALLLFSFFLLLLPLALNSITRPAPLRCPETTFQRLFSPSANQYSDAAAALSFSFPLDDLPRMSIYYVDISIISRPPPLPLDDLPKMF